MFTLTPRITREVTVTGEPIARQGEVLTPSALEFLAKLHHAFVGRRQELLLNRMQRRTRIANGVDPTFPSETATVRNDDTWTVAPPAPGLEDRRVEITGPCDRKMTVNALNSGAKCWLADLEDSASPTWPNVVNAQLNLMDVLSGDLDFETEQGKSYRLRSHTLTDLPTIIVRPRGWHLAERHLWIDGVPMSAALVDFGLYFFHNAHKLVSSGRGPYFYLPKLESYREARLWNDVFVMAQQLLDIPHGTIRATVLIETITAAFEMEEILYELRDHSAGLNAGRWDYIFSVIKHFAERGSHYVLPDRERVTMTAPFMRAYTEQLVRVCHRRGASAIGGMAAFIPSRSDADVNDAAITKVRADKNREADDGFDGTWVAHPDLVAVAMRVFDEALGDRPNQIHRTRDDVRPDAAALLDVAATEGDVTEAGIRTNIEVAIRYIESWLRGTGAVAIHHLMEDAATAEICRSQIWQWIRNETRTDTGRVVTGQWVAELVKDEFTRLERGRGDRFDDALDIFTECALGENFPTFLTLSAYSRYLCRPEDIP